MFINEDILIERKRERGFTYVASDSTFGKLTPLCLASRTRIDTACFKSPIDCRSRVPNRDSVPVVDTCADEALDDWR